MWISLLIRTYSLMALLDNGGLLNTLLVSLGFERIKIIGTGGAVILGMIYDFLPYMVLPIFTVLTKLDPRYIEAAADLGCNGLQVLGRVILPLSLPGVISGITMVFVPSISTFYISQKLGGGAFELIGDTIERQFQHPSTYHTGAAISLVMMILIIISVAIMGFRTMAGVCGMKVFSKIYMGLVFALLYAPILVLVIYSFNEAGELGSFSRVSLYWYRQLFRDAKAFESLKNSLFLAVTSSVLATVIGTFAALGLDRMRRRYIRNAIMSVTNIPMMNPDIVTGVSMMLFFVASASILGLASPLGHLNDNSAHHLQYTLCNSLGEAALSADGQKSHRGRARPRQYPVPRLL